MSSPDSPPTVQIMDTTLRDGEQSPQLSYTPGEKLQLARALLSRVSVDRIEIASAGASEGEREAVRCISAWARDAGELDRVEVLGFCDAERSPRWLSELGARRMNLLTKGSERHCRGQLGATPEQHFAAIEQSFEAAQRCGVQVAGAYLEDWSRGIVEAPQYVMALTARLVSLGVSRVFLPDTLGCLAPQDVSRHVSRMLEVFPDVSFEFHAHNDYGLATANCLAAVAAGARGVHTTVNGLGERAGNASLAEVVVALHDHAQVRTRVAQTALCEIASRVAALSGKRFADNTPVVGRDVFTQTAGLHADGDRKAGLYESQLAPQRFGRKRAYALGKLSGRASLDQNLEALGLTISEPERERLLARIVELGDRKQVVHSSDLARILSKLRSGELGPGA
jgi:(R)-citramalate synthase